MPLPTKRGTMMRLKDIEYWRAEWEKCALKAIADRDLSGWHFACAKLWTAEFIAGFTDPPDYQQPMDRMPYTAPAESTGTSPSFARWKEGQDHV